MLCCAHTSLPPGAAAEALQPASAQRLGASLQRRTFWRSWLRKMMVQLCLEALPAILRSAPLISRAWAPTAMREAAPRDGNAGEAGLPKPSMHIPAEQHCPARPLAGPHVACTPVLTLQLPDLPLQLRPRHQSRHRVNGHHVDSRGPAAAGDRCVCVCVRVLHSASAQRGVLRCAVAGQGGAALCNEELETGGDSAAAGTAHARRPQHQQIWAADVALRGILGSPDEGVCHLQRHLPAVRLAQQQLVNIHPQALQAGPGHGGSMPDSSAQLAGHGQRHSCGRRRPARACGLPTPQGRRTSPPLRTPGQRRAPRRSAPQRRPAAAPRPWHAVPASSCRSTLQRVAPDGRTGPCSSGAAVPLGRQGRGAAPAFPAQSATSPPRVHDYPRRRCTPPLPFPLFAMPSCATPSCVTPCRPPTWAVDLHHPALGVAPAQRQVKRERAGGGGHAAMEGRPASRGRCRLHNAARFPGTCRREALPVPCGQADAGHSSWHAGVRARRAARQGPPGLAPGLQRPCSSHFAVAVAAQLHDAVLAKPGVDLLEHRVQGAGLRQEARQACLSQGRATAPMGCRSAGRRGWVQARLPAAQASLVQRRSGQRPKPEEPDAAALPASVSHSDANPHLGLGGGISHRRCFSACRTRRHCRRRAAAGLTHACVRCHKGGREGSSTAQQPAAAAHGKGPQHSAASAAAAATAAVLPSPKGGDGGRAASHGQGHVRLPLWGL